MINGTQDILWAIGPSIPASATANLVQHSDKGHAVVNFVLGGEYGVSPTATTTSDDNSGTVATVADLVHVWATVFAVVIGALLL